MKILFFIKKYLLIIICSILIFSLSVANLISENKNFSPTENRYLQQKPKFSFKKFAYGDFSSKYEEFINDQFIFRDNWITLKMISEMLLLKLENNNIIIGKNNYLFDKLTLIDEDKLNNNINQIFKYITNNFNKNIFFTIVPNSYEVLKEYLPKGFNNINQEYYINKVYIKLNQSNLKNLTLIDAKKYLTGKKEKIYYSTDHHWTTTGAYFFYRGLANILNYKPIELNSLTKRTVNNFYGTYYSRAKISWKNPDIIEYYKPSFKSIDVDGKKYNSLYDIDKFNQKDKYAGFLHGNNGLTTITSKYSKLKKENILIIKDSYANSFIPFLTYNYNNIFVIDLRYINNKNIKNFFIKNKNINEILIMYNFINFSTDNNISKINYLNN